MTDDDSIESLLHCDFFYQIALGFIAQDVNLLCLHLKRPARWYSTGLESRFQQKPSVGKPRAIVRSRAKIQIVVFFMISLPTKYVHFHSIHYVTLRELFSLYL
jgi:hypothetical protein